MSRSQNLRHSVINQVIRDMARSNIPSPLPPQNRLTEIYNISHTTARHALQHLSTCDMLTLMGKNYATARKPEQSDGFDCITASLRGQNRLFEQTFSTMVSLCQLRIGESFSELQLAWVASVSPVVIQEYLLRLGCYDLIRSEKRSQWSVKQFDQSYAERLFGLRGVLETRPL